MVIETNARYGRIVPLRPTNSQFGRPYFSQWGSVVPNMKIKYVEFLSCTSQSLNCY